MTSKAIYTILLLLCSNTFMTFAWYGHLKMAQLPKFSNLGLFAFILISWGIALVEYCFQVPANRIGFDGNGGPFTLMQLKVIQEVITLTVFTIFSILVFGNMQLQWNHFVAFILLIGAVYFIFYK
ncbi:MAG: DMT family protein [Bacteroidales bacterium]|nr:DMT family protein [Bacteroidales bacterium]